MARVDSVNSTPLLLGTTVAGGVGAAALGGLGYLGQKTIIKNASEYKAAAKNELKEMAKQKIDNPAVKKYLEDVIQIARTGKVNKKLVGAAAAVGAVLSAGVYLVARAIKHAYNKERGSIENDTLKVGITGGIIGGIINAVGQKLFIRNLNKQSEAVDNAINQLQQEKKNTSFFKLGKLKEIKANISALTDKKAAISNAIENTKFSKSAVAGAAAKGAVLLGAAYAAARGVTSLLFKRRPMKVVAYQTDASGRTVPVEAEIVD